MAKVYQKRTRRFIALDRRFGAQNYASIPVVLTRGSGVRVTDVEGRSYFDFLSAYSALNQGHNHPRIVRAASAQMKKLSLTSRAFYNDLLPGFLARLCRLTGHEKAIMMNSGAEGVETAIKAMRLWGYRKKGIRPGQAEILVAEGNFHGRTTTIVGFSSDPLAVEGFGPATPGFRIIPYGSAKALEKAITPRTCGFLVEPIQGEAGVRIPPEGYLREVRRICSRRNVLFCADEIQTGLGRTGKLFCVDHEKVKPDLLVMGKALSGGLYPVSAVTSKRGILGLFTPGTHGSTYGGNPLACAIAGAALDVITEEALPARSARLGDHFLRRLSELRHPLLKEVRGRGLLIALEFKKPVAKALCRELMRGGLLAKDTHGTTVRFAPPLIITKSQLDRAFLLVRRALTTLPTR